MTKNSNARLILLPGLGADARLFAPQFAAFPELIVPPWIKPLPGETLPAYGERMAGYLAPTINGSPFVLGGVSFGGMAALEIAKHLKPQAVILIASNRAGRHIKLLHTLLRALVPLLSPQLMRLIKKWIAPYTLHRLGAMDLVQRELCLAMLGDTDVDFFKWAAGALLDWEFTGEFDCPVHAIHGGKDKIIPLSRVRADVVIADAGHVLNLTHAVPVNDFIRDILEKIL